MANLLNLREDLHTELKKSKSSLSNDLWETYSAFANTDGGTIYLGIDQNKNGENIIEGVENIEKQKKELFDQANDKTKVSVDLLSEEDVETIEFKPGVFVLKITVPKANALEKPVFIKGQKKYSYRRKFSADYQCTLEQIESMDLKRSSALKDSQINEYKYDLSFIDEKSLQILYGLVDRLNNAKDLNKMSKEVLLSKLGLAVKENGKYLLTNAGVLMLTSSECIQRIYPRYFLDYQEKNVIEPNRWDYRFDTDDLTNAGNILEFYDQVFRSLLKGLPNRFELTNGINTSGRNMMEVIREAIINCLSNCDFILGGIKIVKGVDKIVFSNLGELNVDIAQAIKGGVTNPRNNQIHTVFRKLGLVEKSGTGIPKIFENCKKEKLPSPVLFNDYNNNRTLLTIYTINTELPEPDDDTLRILDLILNTPSGITKKEIINKLGFSSTKIYNSLKELLNSRKIKTNKKFTNKLLYYPNIE